MALARSWCCGCIVHCVKTEIEMGYNNYGNPQNYDFNNYNSGGGNSSNYNNNLGGQNNRKSSGSKMSTISKGQYQGEQCVTGWNKQKRRGFISILCAPYKGTHEFTTQQGRKGVVWIAKVQFKDQGREDVFPCIYWPDKRICVISKLDMVLNPAKDYCGTYNRSRRR